MSRAFSSAYLDGDPSAHAFLPADFRDRKTRLEVTRLAAGRRTDASLLAVLREQQAALAPSAARQSNLDALAAGGCAVVVTGQQVGLFLGPLYGLYKAASAVAVARALQVESGTRCVPLFWLQTEDHDFPEIASATVAGRDGQPVRLSLQADADGDASRASLAHRSLGPELPSLLATLAETLPAGPAADEVLSLLRTHYQPGRSPGAAFAGVLSALFADEGLLVFDPRDARVAAQASPLYRTALDSAGAISARLGERGAALAAAGFAEQVPVRPDCALLFLHREHPEGPRYRLEPRAGGWALAGATDAYTTAELDDLLAHAPLRFSTSALLRPLVQDHLFPVAAYVGGPGEINYFAQLGPLYEHFGVAPALVVPRARFRCLDARSRRLAEQVGIPFDQPGLTFAASEIEAHVPVTAPEGAPDPRSLRAFAEELNLPVDDLARAVEGIDPQLKRAAQRTRETVARALKRLVDRYERTLRDRDKVTVDRVTRLQQALLPDGVPQERYYSWPSLAGRIGPHAFKRLVFDNLEREGPFLTHLRDLTV